VCTVVLADGKLEIPTNVRSQLHLQDGDALEIEVTHGAILLRPLDTLTENERFHIRSWTRRHCRRSCSGGG